MATIFERAPLSAGQLRMVAERRLEDARYLLSSGKSRHANGAMYLAGFVVECCLKARLLEKRPELARENPRADSDERRLRRLLYGHDLAALLAAVPEVRQEIAQRHALSEASRVAKVFQEVCGTWTIFARYSARQESLSAARVFLGRVKEVRTWL